jgi:predicted negative regulator of RcsB-dependent stress response
MTPDQVAMLVAGILLFVVALGLLIYCVVTRRPFKAVLFIFLIAIIMIGFPSIQSFKVLGAEVELNRSLQAAEANPNDQAAKARLAAAVAQVSQQRNIAPQTRVTLAKAQLILGRPDEAAANVRSALKMRPGLNVDAKLKALVRPSPP